MHVCRTFGVFGFVALMTYTALVCISRLDSRRDAMTVGLVFAFVGSIMLGAFLRFQGRYVARVTNEGVELCNGTKFSWPMVQRLEPIGVTPWVVMTDGQRVPISFDYPDNMGAAFALIRANTTASRQG